MTSGIREGISTMAMVFLVPTIFLILCFVSEILFVYYSAGVIDYELKRAVTISVTEELVDELQKDRYSTADVDEIIQRSVDQYLIDKELDGKRYTLKSLEVKKVNDKLYTVGGSFERPSFFFSKILGNFKWTIPFNARCRIQRLD